MAQRPPDQILVPVQPFYACAACTRWSQDLWLYQAHEGAEGGIRIYNAWLCPGCRAEPLGTLLGRDGWTRAGAQPALTDAQLALLPRSLCAGCRHWRSIVSVYYHQVAAPPDGRVYEFHVHLCQECSQRADGWPATAPDGTLRPEWLEEITV